MPVIIKGQILFKSTHFLEAIKIIKLIIASYIKIKGTTVFGEMRMTNNGTETNANPKLVNPFVTPARKIIKSSNMIINPPSIPYFPESS